MRILKRIVAISIAVVILYAIVAIISNLPYSVLPPILAGLAIILFSLSILKINSPIKFRDAANLGAMYSVITLLISAQIYLNARIDATNVRIDATNVRIDDIYQILITMQ